MKINIDIEEFIKSNECLEVTSTYIFDGDSSVLNEQGIFSPTIFGRVGSDDRKRRRGFIDLKGNYLHPMIYHALTSSFQVMKSVIAGEQYIRLSPTGHILKEDDPSKPGAFTGLQAIYDNWNRFNFNSPDGKNTTSRQILVDLVKAHKRDECFVNKWLVIAAFFRDINLHTIQGGGRIELEEINTLYIKLIGYANGDSVTFVNAYYTQNNIQLALNDIYELLTNGRIAKKNGLIHAAIMGKTVDRAAICVISAPRFNSNTYQDQSVPYNHIRVPLPILVNLFYPFVINFITDLFADVIGLDRIIVSGKNLDTSDAMDEVISTDAVEKLVGSFIKDKTKSIRIANFTIDGTSKGRLSSIEKRLGRPYTVTDLMFFAIASIIPNKHVLSTRFPVSGSESQAICKPLIGSTERTIDLSSGSGSDFDNYHKEYPYFPTNSKGEIDFKKIAWVDSVQPNNTYLPGMGGDFDGDTFRLIGLYTDEANQLAQEITNSITNYVDASGNFFRSLGREGGLGLYMLTAN